MFIVHLEAGKLIRWVFFAGMFLAFAHDAWGWL